MYDDAFVDISEDYYKPNVRSVDVALIKLENVANHGVVKLPALDDSTLYTKYLTFGWGMSTVDIWDDYRNDDNYYRALESFGFIARKIGLKT